MTKRMIKPFLLTSVFLPSILPSGCSRQLLTELTPILIDGSNNFLVETLFLVAPFVLP